MTREIDAGVELLVELIKEPLNALRNDMWEKIELAIQIAAGNLPGPAAHSKSLNANEQEACN